MVLRGFFVVLGGSSCRVVCLDYECAFCGAAWPFMLCWVTLPVVSCV
jgi:hypothetical protein